MKMGKLRLPQLRGIEQFTHPVTGGPDSDPGLSALYHGPAGCNDINWSAQDKERDRLTLQFMGFCCPLLPR